MSDSVTVSMGIREWNALKIELDTLREKQRKHDAERSEALAAVARMERAIRNNGVLLAWEMRPRDGVFELRAKFAEELVRASGMRPAQVVALAVADKIDEWDQAQKKA